MKKLLLLLPVFAFVSCSETIDKKIILTDYGKEIEIVKVKNKEYTPEDFATASKILDKHSFKAMSDGNMNLDITYKELLDDAKAENAKTAKEISKYEASLKPINDVLDINLVRTKYIENKDPSAVYPFLYAYAIELKNTSKNKIVLISGQFILKNEKGDLLTTINLKQEGVLPVNTLVEHADAKILDIDDNKAELKVLPLERIKVTWIPEEIMFEGGDRITALKRPYGHKL